MIGTYASAALICAASMLVGHAILGLTGGGESRRWLAPAVGFGAVADGDRLPRPGAGARDQRDDRPRPPGHRRGGTCSGGGRARPAAHRCCARGGRSRSSSPRLLDPVRGQRPLGDHRRRIQQRPRPAPGLGRVVAQRPRPGAGSRLPAGTSRAGRGRRRSAGHRSRARLSSARSSRSASSPRWSR